MGDLSFFLCPPSEFVSLLYFFGTQLLVAYVIELLGWFGVEKQPLEWRKVIGMAVAIVGIVVFKWE